MALAVGVSAARDEFLGQAGARELAIQSVHVVRAAELPPLHRDPFDRVLIAQALSEQLTLVTADDVIRRYGVATTWAT